MKRDNDRETEMNSGVQLTAVSYDSTQTALVTAGRATVGGKPVTAEINGIATGKGEDGTVNLWLPAFSFKSGDGEVKKVPGLNAVATLHPHQAALATARTIASSVNRARTAYKATVKGSRRHASINIVFTGKNCVKPKTGEY